MQPTNNDGKESDLDETIYGVPDAEGLVTVKPIKVENPKTTEKAQNQTVEKPKTVEKQVNDEGWVTLKNNISPEAASSLNENESPVTSTAKKVVKKTRSKTSKGSSSSIVGESSGSKIGESPKESIETLEPPPSTTKRPTRVSKQKAASAIVDEETAKAKKKLVKKKKL